MLTYAISASSRPRTFELVSDRFEQVSAAESQQKRISVKLSQRRSESSKSANFKSTSILFSTQTNTSQPIGLFLQFEPEEGGQWRLRRLAVQSQEREPVSSTNSLLNGNLQGNFVILPAGWGTKSTKMAWNQPFLITSANMEQGNFDLGTGKTIGVSASSLTQIQTLRSRDGNAIAEWLQRRLKRQAA